MNDSSNEIKNLIDYMCSTNEEETFKLDDVLNDIFLNHPRIRKHIHKKIYFDEEEDEDGFNLE